MDSATNCALASPLIRILDGATAHLTVPLWPALVGLVLILAGSTVAAVLDVESLFLIVISMCIMLLDFMKSWPFTKSKHRAAKGYPMVDVQHSVPQPQHQPTQAAADWYINLDPETVALDAALSDLCDSLFGPRRGISATKPACNLIAVGPALLEPPSKLGRVLDVVGRIAAEAVPCSKVYGFERTRTSPGFPGGSMEIVIVTPCSVLVEQLGERLQRGIKGGHLMLSSSQLHKSALRYLIDRLVNEGFKFRCSAFKAQEPTVALSPPLGFTGGQCVYVSLSVNNPLPFLEASLLQQASVSDPRAVPLIAAVQCWAEERGLAHPVFGPLTMYGWVHACLFFLTQVAQPRMAALVLDPRWKGIPTQKYDKSNAQVEPILLEKFFEFCARFPYGRSRMWLQENCAGPAAPFIEDALRPGIDLGYHLQHRLPRKQLQGEAALAASALKQQSPGVNTLAELGPLKTRSSGPRKSLHPHWDNHADDELRMMKKTRASQQRPTEVAVMGEQWWRSNGGKKPPATTGAAAENEQPWRSVSRVAETEMRCSESSEASE